MPWCPQIRWQVPAGPALALAPSSPGASTLTVVAASAGQPPGHVGIHARRHAGDPGARRPAVIPGSELPGNCRGTAILAAAAWRCLDHLVGPLRRDVV